MKIYKMKGYVLLNALLFGIIFTGLMSTISCKKRGPEYQLVEAINNSPLGIKIDPAKISASVKKSGERYTIIYKNTPFILDISGYKNFFGGMDLQAKPVTVHVDEITFLYDPGAKYLEIASFKGLNFEIDSLSKMTDFKHKPATPTSIGMKISLSIGNSEMKNYILSPILTYEGKDLIELLGMMNTASEVQNGITEKIHFIMNTEEKGINFSLDFTVDKMEYEQRANSNLFLNLYKKDAPIPDVNEALNKGNSLFDIGLHLTGLNILAGNNKSVPNHFTLQEISLNYFMKPNDSKTQFNFGSDCKLKKLRFTVPEIKLIGVIFDIDELTSSFSLENLSSDFIKSYFELVRNARELNKPGLDEKTRQQQEMTMAMSAMKMGGEFTRSKPAIKLSINPMKHHFGEISIESNVQFVNLWPPVGITTFKIPKIENVLNNLKEANVMAPQTFSMLEKFVQKLFIKDKNGDASLISEIREDQPGKNFLNGKVVDLSALLNTEKAQKPEKK